MMIEVIVSVCLVSCLLLIISEWKIFKPGKVLFKLIASSAFVVLAFILTKQWHPFNTCMVIGFILSMVGDLFLIPDKSRNTFISGMIAFGLAHLSFTIAFILIGVTSTWLYISFGTVLFLVIPSYLWLKPNLKAAYRYLVPGYMFLIAVMILFSGFAVGGESGSSLLFGGALLFGISDLFVARNQFVKKELVNKMIGLPLYYIAQLILVLSLIN